MSKPLKAFITYSHENKTERDKLIKCLAVMKRTGELNTWYDGKISGGDSWNEEIAKNLAESDILIHLVSVDSLASDPCDNEIITASKLKIKVFHVIWEACDWKGDQQMASLLVFPEDGKPINKWVPESDGWQNVVDGIRKTIKGMEEKKDQDSFVDLFQAGNALMIIKKFTEAIRKYSSAIKLTPDYADAYNNRGVAHTYKKEYEQALKDYNKVIELNPDNTIAYNNRGTTYMNMKEYDRAIEDYSKAIVLNPNFADTYNNRGAAYGNKGDHARAVKDFNKAIELNPDYAEAYYNRGVTYRAMGDDGQANADFDKARAFDPSRFKDSP